MSLPTVTASSLILATSLPAAGGTGNLPVYRVTTLEAPPAGVSASASGLGDDGVAVGTFFNLTLGYFDGVIWDAAGTPSTMTGVYGFEEANAVSVAGDGTILGSGTLDAASEVSHGAFIAPDGTVTVLPSLAPDTGVISIVFAMNSSGLSVGRSAVIPWPNWLEVPNDAVLWEEGVITSIGTLGGYLGTATGVNDKGLVIGSSNTATSDFPRGFVWDSVDGMREITPLVPGGTGHVEDLDESGRIVGRVQDPTGFVQACFWPGPDAPPELLPLPAGASTSAALALNEAGDVVGRAAAGLFDERAVLWTEEGGHDLNALLLEPSPLVFAGALDVNEVGQILVTSEFDPELGLVSAVLTPLLHAQPASISLSAGGTQELRIDAGPDFASQTYLVLGSLSGTAPGLPLGPFTLPLNPDDYLVFTITNAGVPPLVDTFGQLDEDGRSQASFELPPGFNPALAGLELHHAYAVLDFSGPVEALLVSNAEGLTLEP